MACTTQYGLVLLLAFILSLIAKKSESFKMSKTALFLGGVGETGKEVLKLSVTTPVYGRVVCLGRKKEYISRGMAEQREDDFDTHT